MRRENRASLIIRQVIDALRAGPWSVCTLSLAACLIVGCDSQPPAPAGGPGSSVKPSGWSQVRAERRAYDGAPPVIPHMQMGANCASCHSQTGIQFGEMGFAPPMPHATDGGKGSFARCEQCHVYVEESGLFVENVFQPLRQDLRKGRRATPLAPPTMPHPVFMRENCAACHTGPAAREEIKCPHPERIRCGQCHVPLNDNSEYSRADRVL